MMKRKWPMTIEYGRQPVTVSEMLGTKNKYNTRRKDMFKRYKPTRYDDDNLNSINIPLYAVVQNVAESGNTMAIILSFLNFTEIVTCKRVCKIFACHINRPYAWTRMNKSVAIRIEVDSLKSLEPIKRKSIAEIKHQLQHLIKRFITTTNGLYDTSLIQGGERNSRYVSDYKRLAANMISATEYTAYTRGDITYLGCIQNQFHFDHNGKFLCTT